MVDLASFSIPLQVARPSIFRTRRLSAIQVSRVLAFSEGWLITCCQPFFRVPPRYGLSVTPFSGRLLPMRKTRNPLQWAAARV